MTRQKADSALKWEDNTFFEKLHKNIRQGKCCSDQLTVRHGTSRYFLQLSKNCHQSPTKKKLSRTRNSQQLRSCQQIETTE